MRIYNTKTHMKTDWWGDVHFLSIYTCMHMCACRYIHTKYQGIKFLDTDR